MSESQVIDPAIQGQARFQISKELVRYVRRHYPIRERGFRRSHEDLSACRWTAGTACHGGRRQLAETAARTDG